MKRIARFIVALVAIASCVAIVGCSQATGSADSAITVSASGSAEVTPDTASIGVVVATQGDTEEAARANVERISNDVIAHLKTAGAAEANIHVTTSDPVAKYGEVAREEIPSGYYDWDGNWIETYEEVYYDETEELIGYDISTTIRVDEADISQVNVMLRESAAAGATGFTDFTYSVKNREAAYQKALSAAVEKAHAKAEALAQASSVYVGRVVNMVENSEAASLVLTVAGDTSKLDAANVSTLEIDPGSIPVEASVTVSYAIS